MNVISYNKYMPTIHGYITVNLIHKILIINIFLIVLKLGNPIVNLVQIIVSR